MNKGSLNIAFSRLNLHTQLIFVLATILAFQIIKENLEKFKNSSLVQMILTVDV